MVIFNLLNRLRCLGILRLVLYLSYSLNFFQLQHRQLLLPLCQWRLQLIRLQLVLDYHNIIDRTRTRIVMQHTEVRIFHLHHSIAAQICNNFGGLRTEILRQKNRDQIFLIGIFLQIMACKLTNLSDFRSDKNCPALRQNDGLFEV